MKWKHNIRILLHAKHMIDQVLPDVDNTIFLLESERLSRIWRRRET